MDVLGLLLVGGLAATWGTGLLYLIARAGFASPVRLAAVDGIHVYTGLAAATILVLKVRRVGWRLHAPARGGATLWQRGVSASLAFLYIGVFVTGVGAVVPAGPAVRAAFVQAHLMTSIWAAFPTTLHLLHHGGRWQRLWVRRPRISRRAVAGAAALVAAALLLLALFPVALAPITEAAAGGSWHPAGLQGIGIAQVAATPDGHGVVAGGDGIYVSSAGTGWRHLGLLGPGDAGHVSADEISHAAHLLPPGSILSLATSAGPAAVYAGSSGGLYWTPDLNSPFTQDHLAAIDIRSVVVDPADPYERWVATSSGVWFTWVFGHGWTFESRGLPAPSEVTSLGFFGRQLYTSEGNAVYRWSGSHWRLARRVGSGALQLSSDGAVLVATGAREIDVLDRSGWHRAAPLAGHQHGGTVHAPTLAVAGDMLVAAEGTELVVSRDEGASWSPITSAPVLVLQVARVADTLYAATPDGVYSYQLDNARSGSLAWWGLMLLLGAGTGSVLALSLARRRTR